MLKNKVALSIIAVCVLLFTVGGCMESKPDPTDQARKARSEGVKQIRAKQPVQAMTYSPTLDTINGWAKTWGTRGKVSYVYMQRADGSFAGYYVLKGLPVSYCASGSPTWDKTDIDTGDYGGEAIVAAPGLDGAYYGGSGNCNRYYGFDAVSGQYVEYTDGMVLTAVLSDSPLPLDKQPMAFGSTIEDVKKSK